MPFPPIPLNKPSDLRGTSSPLRQCAPLLRTAALSILLAGSLSACAPLVVGSLVGGGLWLAADRRTSGAQIDDEAIELRGGNRVRAALENRGRVFITSYNRMVLLTGQVPTQADKDLAEGTLRTVPNVRHVVNELTVGPNTPSNAADALTSTRVKTALVGSRNVRSNAVKVTTENGVVYLMGLVTQQESDRAAEVASGVTGVLKVVKVFEIVSDAAIGNVAPVFAPPPATATTPSAAPAAPGTTTP
ncbi:MAG: BON domain-containing protein [Brachymonas sp.]|nr:BON domain-containing protein [Brachymonas sp.]